MKIFTRFSFSFVNSLYYFLEKRGIELCIFVIKIILTIIFAIVLGFSITGRIYFNKTENDFNEQEKTKIILTIYWRRIYGIPFIVSYQT